MRLSGDFVKMDLQRITEPELVFGGGECTRDPKVGLTQYGPVGSRPAQTIPVSVGLVCVPDQAPAILSWIRRLSALQIDTERNALKFPAYPGSDQAFRANFEIEDRFIRPISQARLDLAFAEPESARIDAVLGLYIEAIQSLFVDGGPRAIVVHFPEPVASLRTHNPRLSYQEQRLLQWLQEEDTNQQMGLFDDFSAEERKAAAELFPQADELLFRSFYRVLKARSMNLPNAVPTQIIREHTYTDTPTTQGPATKAWNFGAALFYKSTAIPWRPAALTPGTCYVGVTFHHLKRRSGGIVYASLAQALSSETEPFALRGAMLDKDQRKGKQPFLTAEQAEGLMTRVLKQYRLQTGMLPNRLVVHKTSTYQPEEVEGIQSGLNGTVPLIDLVWLRPTGLRLIRRGDIEPERGTMVTLEGERTYLYTTGYIPWWKEYPGPHIPAPLELGQESDSDVTDIGKEILALTKMNWNSADGIGRHPITLSFARQVGTIMTEIDTTDDEGESQINPLYRFYM